LIGVDLSSIAVILGVLGIGLGFGLQNLVANVFAGFVILFTKPVKEGDFITVGTNNGTVTKINTVSTIVTTKLNETIIVPNSVLISDVIFNNTYSDRTIIIKNSVMVSYDSDIDYIRSLLVSIANRSPYNVNNDEPEARISSFERTGIDMVLYSTAKEVYDRGAATAWINFEIWKEFKEKGIKIPVAFIDVNIK
jgi:small-conductance mechanosensitive channel